MDQVGPPVYVLGVNAGPHDGSAVLLRNGELVVMVEQERLSGNRHAIGESPAAAIQACLAHEGIGLPALTCIAVGWDVPVLADIEGSRFDEAEFLGWLLGTPAAQPHGKQPQAAPGIRYVDHHLAHAASAFYTSGMAEAAIIIADGRGEAVSTTVAVGTRAGIQVLRTWGIEKSLGHFYGWAAEWAGLGMWGTGKLMGLAAYGQPRQPVPLTTGPDVFTLTDCDISGAPARYQFALMRSRLRASFRAHNFPFAQAEPADAMAYADFAASVQHALEGSLFGLARHARRETGLSHAVLAGGVALNCSVNGHLLRSGIFDEVWIPPFPNDAGVSLGAALIADRELRGISGPAPRLEHAFWGPRDPVTARASLAGLGGLSVEQYNDATLAETVADHLVAGNLVGWWQGRAEVGPRALGARSILCDPRHRSAVSRVNSVKGREPWRPLAPAVLGEWTGLCFGTEPPTAADFMLAAWPVREQARTWMPVAVHVDGSTRPQVVRSGQARYRAVIEAFRERTGVPAIINTSFNFNGAPMVASATDAVSAFLGSGLDLLVVDDLVVTRPAQARQAAATGEQLRAFSFTPWAQPCQAQPNAVRA